jgi:hypothetical protein
MKIPLLFLPIIAFALSCNTETMEAPSDDKDEIVENLSLEELAKRQVESQLSIPGTENYKLEIHRAHFDGDDIEDAVILVNREEFAHTSTSKDRVASQEQVAYTGNYNHLFYYNGATNKVSRPINIGSSPFASLKINILNIQSEAYKDFTLDYRIMENCYRNYYTIFRGVPKLVFQWPIFILENNKDQQVNYIEFARGSYSLAKDILIYEGKIDTPLPENLRTDFDYSISKDGKMEYQFFYNPKQGKYFTNEK